MTVRSPFLFEMSPSAVWAKVLPILLIVFLSTFASAQGPTTMLGNALCAGCSAAAGGVIGLFTLFCLLKPEGWSVRNAIESAETITLWLAAVIGTAYLL